MPPAEKQAWVARAEADKQRYLTELASYVPPPGYDAKGDAMSGPFSAKSVKRPSSANVKDVNAPKRNMSAYLLYQNAMRDQFKRENPGMTFGQLAKYTSHMYRNLTPEEKATWVARSQQDKARYDAELASYVPPPGHDARGVLIEDHRPRKRGKRAPKDPAAPKRASGAYVFFTNEMRPIILQEFPGIKFVELGRVLGERWRALRPDEKKRFEDMAPQDKVRFQMEMQQYTANKAATAAQMQQSHAAHVAEQQQHYSHDPKVAAPSAHMQSSHTEHYSQTAAKAPAAAHVQSSHAPHAEHYSHNPKAPTATHIQSSHAPHAEQHYSHDPKAAPPQAHIQSHAEQHY